MKTFILAKGKYYINSLVYLILISIFCSCAVKKTRCQLNASNWELQGLDATRIPNHTTYLVGDAGNSKKPGDTVQVIKYLKKALSKESEHSSIVFLGDNIYQKGLPTSTKKKKYDKATYRLRTQLDVLDKFKGNAVFVAGNHDWKSGFYGLKLQQDIVKNQKTRIGRSYYEPIAGSPGPSIVDLGEVVIVTIDSHELITHWNEQTYGGGTVGAKFTIDFDKMIDNLQSKNVVVAMHHPPYTYGPHGGRFNFKQYLFPGTEKVSWLWLPSPTLGVLSKIFLPKAKLWANIITGVVSLPVLYVFGRKHIIKPEQDVINKDYQSFKNSLLTGVENKGRFTFVSGHEHTLQYLENDNHNFVVSGSGSKTSPVGMGNESLFSSSSVGFSTLSFFEGGETWVTYYEVTKDGKNAPVIFQKRIK